MSDYRPTPQRRTYENRYIITYNGIRHEWLADDVETAVQTFCHSKHANSEKCSITAATTSASTTTQTSSILGRMIKLLQS